MTDLEMTKLCAEAMGMCVVAAYTDLSGPRVRAFHVRTDHQAAPSAIIYDPLHDDAQAMGLIKRFHIQLTKTLRTPEDNFGKWIATKTDECMSGPMTDLNRAIVECVAQMMKTKA